MNYEFSTSVSYYISFARNDATEKYYESLSPYRYNNHSDIKESRPSSSSTSSASTTTTIQSIISEYPGLMTPPIAIGSKEVSNERAKVAKNENAASSTAATNHAISSKANTAPSTVSNDEDTDQGCTKSRCIIV